VFALRGHANAVNALAVASDGRTLATANADRSARVWDLVSGRERRSLAGAGSTIAFSPDGKIIVSAGEDKTVRLWDAASGRELRTLHGHAHQVYAVAFSPDGKLLASGSHDDTVRLWDAASGREVRVLKGHQDSVRSVAFSPDGKTLVSGSYDDAIKLWDVASGQERRTLKGHANRVNAVAYSPDGKFIASGAEDQTVRLWDAANGQELRTLRGHGGAVLAVAFAPDSKQLASTGRDRSVRVWDATSGQALRTFSVPVGRMSAVAFTPDGRTLIAGGDDGALRLWDPASGKERVSFYNFREGEWIAITPEGFYQSSAQGGRYLNVRIGERVSSIDQYLESFFRPDRVQLALAGLPPPTPVTRPIEPEPALPTVATAPAIPVPEAKPEAATPPPAPAPAPVSIVAIKPAPDVAIVNTPTRLTTDEATVKLKITDAGGGIGDVRLYLNGTAVVFDKSRNLQVAARPAAGQEISYKLRLVPGRNSVRAVAFNADNSMQSADAVHEIAVEIAVVKRPALHAIVVGINEYENPKLQLSYAVADANLFSATLREKSAGLFGAVNIKTLVSRAETTRTAITNELKALRGRVGPDDLFVFYVASHGTVDEGEYFLITSNVGATSTRKLQQDALRQNDIKELIANVPTTKKLVVLDTCNAGKLGEAIQVAVLTRGLNEDAALKLLSRAVGSTIISASSSVQEALEGYKGHGLFTYIVAEGLKGKADMNRDGFVKTSELADYVEEEVPALAEKVFKHKQFPNTSLSGTIFPVSKVR
jgi:WD40 repeat protein